MPHLNRNPNRGSRFTFHVSRFKAFSLLEFIGVLGIIALIVAALIPNVIKRIDRAAWVKENAALAAFSGAFIQHTLKSNNIPGDQGWAQAIGAELGLATSDVTTNSRRLARAFLVDDSGWLSTNLNAASGWTQTPSGASNSPGGARFLIISSLAGSLGDVTNFFSVGGTRKGSTVFNDIWNTQQGFKPALAVWNNYKGNADDLLIQRINVEPLFHRLLLVNNDIGSTAPCFSINAFAVSSPNPVPSGAGWASYFLDGTSIGLRSNNAAAGTTALQVSEVIRKDISRVFENNYWRDELGSGANPAGGFDVIAALFFNSQAPPNEKWGSNPKGVTDLLSAFMYGYAAWANQGPCFNSSSGNNNSTKQLPEYQILNGVLGCFLNANGANGGGLLLPP